MVVQHNLTALNSNRLLGLTSKAQAKSTEKLSSGYKINRAADDAAGLAISEKMRKQVRGLTQASANAQDGISAVQTAEGALTEVHDMLQRMNELAVKAANGTNSESDRQAIQSEIDQLVTEIDRVAETTKFNETYLLKGDKSISKSYSYSYKAVKESVAATATMDSDAATGLTAKITFTKGAKASDQNELAKALRDQGITITSETVKDEDGNDVTKFGVTLNGKAAANYNVNTKSNSQFEIVDLQGNQIATVTASVKAAESESESEGATIAEGTTLYDVNGTELDETTLAALLDEDPDAKVYTAAPVLEATPDASNTGATDGTAFTITGTKAGDYTYHDADATYAATGWYLDGDTETVVTTISTTDTAVDGDKITIALDAATQAAEAVAGKDYEYTPADDSTAAASTGKKSAVVTASAIGAAQNANDVAKFYDKDGNAISSNALGNYFSVLSPEKAVEEEEEEEEEEEARTTIADGKTLYDKDGNAIADADALEAILDADENAKVYTDAPTKGTCDNTNVTVTGLPTDAAIGDEYTFNGTVWTKDGTGVTGLTITGGTPSNGDKVTVEFDAASATAAVKGNDYTYVPQAEEEEETGAEDAASVAAKAGYQLYDAVGNEISMTDAAGSVSANQNLTGALNLKLHVGADATTNNQIDLNIQAMSAKGLGLNGLKVAGSDDSNSLSAINTIQEAIQKVSAQRSVMGAVQNRLEHTINNLDNVVENTTSAESAIRDTDMATEMVKYANNNILAQAGQSMLAQANQSNQGVLSLLG